MGFCPSCSEREKPLPLALDNPLYERKRCKVFIEKENFQMTLRIWHLFTWNRPEASKSPLLRRGDRGTVKCDFLPRVLCPGRQLQGFGPRRVFCGHWFVISAHLVLPTSFFSPSIDVQGFYFSMCTAVAGNCRTTPWAFVPLLSASSVYAFQIFVCC